MALSEFVNQILLPLGGTSAVLIALAVFLGNISTKRIVNGDLAQYKLKLEEFKKEIELLKLDHQKEMENVQNEFRVKFLKHEVYTSISKEKYQELFEKRIAVYEEFLRIKNEIDESIVENAEYIETHDDDPSLFTNDVKKINDASQANTMLISNELAKLSNDLYKKSSQVFFNAKVAGFHEEVNSYNGESVDDQRIMEAEDSELRKMAPECAEVYEEWFKQLNLDVSKIRLILDISSDFLNEKH